MGSKETFTLLLFLLLVISYFFLSQPQRLVLLCFFKENRKCDGMQQPRGERWEGLHLAKHMVLPMWCDDVICSKSNSSVEWLYETNVSSRSGCLQSAIYPISGAPEDFWYLPFFYCVWWMPSTPSGSPKTSNLSSLSDSFYSPFRIF